MKIETGMEMDGVYAYSHGLSRNYALTTEQLIDHIRCVGDAIKEDAEILSIGAHNIRSVSIKTEIAPAHETTYVEYTIERCADPRVTKKSEGKDD